MRTVIIALLAATSLAGALGSAAQADEATYLTPPLYREIARDTQAVRKVSELATIPLPVASAREAVSVSVVGEVLASAASVRDDR